MRIPPTNKKQTNKKFLKKTTTNKQTDKQKLINFQLLVISLSQKRCIHKVSDVLVSHQEKKQNYEYFPSPIVKKKL